MPRRMDGAGTVLADSAVGNPYLFTGRRYDGESGLYYFRTRYLSLNPAVSSSGTRSGSGGIRGIRCRSLLRRQQSVPKPFSAMQNRIGFATANTASLVQNTQAAVSTIKDADMAQGMTEFSRLQILQQAGTAMLAQANQAPQQVLQLFR